MGDHTAKVYVDGPQKVRVQLLDQLAERDAIRNGSDVWLYDSTGEKATHVTLPAHDATSARPDATATTPSALAQRFLAAVDPSTSVTLGSNTNVAGRDAYDLVAPILTPNARGLLLALALVSAGAAALFKPKSPAERFRGGAFVASLAALLALGIGDRTQFITFALAARTPIPALAAIGATVGGLAVLVPAMLAGERAYARLPERSIRLPIAALLLITGAAIGLGALRLL